MWADAPAEAAIEVEPIDVPGNNAGIGWLNALEGTPMAAARELFETNTLGLIAMTQAVLPQMRERRAGVIVNVSSSVTLQPLPLLSVYTGSKAAVNAFSESLALELEPFGVRVRVVLPGRASETSFGNSARARMTDGFPRPTARWCSGSSRDGRRATRLRTPATWRRRCGGRPPILHARYASPPAPTPWRSPDHDLISRDHESNCGSSSQSKEKLRRTAS